MMPTYEFKCKVCGKITSELVPMSELDRLKQTMYHCNILMERYISSGRGFFQRSSFPSEAFEHADFEPRVFRDKYELLDHCEEVGLRSRLLEDGDVP